jgi:hypothetical protein
MKAKRYDEGGDVEKSKTYKAEPAQEGTGLKKESFSEAFARARRYGDKSFEFGGKKYTTELKGEAKAKPSKSEDTKEEKPSKEDKRSRGVAAGFAGAGIGLGTAALLSGMRRSEENRKERELAKGREERTTKSPVRSISAEEAAWEGEGGRSFRKGGKIKKMASGGSASSRGDGIAQRGKTKGRMC